MNRRQALWRSLWGVVASIGAACGMKRAEAHSPVQTTGSVFIPYDNWPNPKPELSLAEFNGHEIRIYGIRENDGIIWISGNAKLDDPWQAFVNPGKLTLRINGFPAVFAQDVSQVGEYRFVEICKGAYSVEVRFEVSGSFRML